MAWINSKEITNLLKISRQCLYYRRKNNLIQYKTIFKKTFYHINDEELKILNNINENK
jgi:hypothetical protein